MSIWSQMALVSSRPFNSSSDHITTFLNEVFISLYLYILFTLTDYSYPNPFRNQCGLALVCTILSSFGVNLLKLLYNIAKEGWKRYQSRKTTALTITSQARKYESPEPEIKMDVEPMKAVETHIIRGQECLNNNNELVLEDIQSN